jgi:BlaI family transcriptional regulator, penicillinase repressor
MRNFLRSDLTRREAQIMEILYRRGRATSAEVRNEMPDPPGQSTVRKLLEILCDKGRVRYEYEGPRHVYYPSVSPEEARRSAIAEVVRTFFHGIPAKAVETLLEVGDLDAGELDRIVELAEKARREGR